MDSLKNKSFKDLEEMVLAIAEKFFFAKGIHDLQNENRLAESDFCEDSPYDSYLLKVQEAYESLCEADRNLINNEFFYQGYSQWWKPLYSKATFYRYKKKAMVKFLGAFYNA